MSHYPHIQRRCRRIWYLATVYQRNGRVIGARQIAREMGMSVTTALEDLIRLEKLGYLAAPPEGKAGIGWRVLLPLVDGTLVRHNA